MGALDVIKVVRKHQAWRLISCIWLHAGVFHILANMLSLLFIGIRLEQEFGFVRIGLLYLFAGFGGSLMSALFIQAGISVGASGALFGLLESGTSLSKLSYTFGFVFLQLAALLTLIFIVVINLAVGLLPHVDNFAHIGGFISGFLLGFVFLIRPQFGYAYTLNTSFVIYFSFLSRFTFGLILLFRGVNLNDQCSWCHYMSCVPTKLWSCKSQQAYCEVSCAALFVYFFLIIEMHGLSIYSVILLQSIEYQNQLNLTCISNGKSSIYNLSGESTSQVQQLCTKLCSR
ncbi:hypothetical protein Golob_009947 [Gossypium lobatum]|uniref:RHOMBOID-like protein n=1 Tax=Gossypium lobatum TaxID=34289 RepID=A0A7J8MJZ1_9ROSI|nr:hypothetical protein [Gossypium lobatum]